MDGLEAIALHDKVIEAIRTCYDPEIPVNIYELGLIYEVKVELSGEVHVKMTLTAPGCPAAISLPGEVEEKVRRLPGVKDVKVEVVWDPPWDPSKMSEAARLQLGMMCDRSGLVGIHDDAGLTGSLAVSGPASGSSTIRSHLSVFSCPARGTDTAPTNLLSLDFLSRHPCHGGERRQA